MNKLKRKYRRRGQTITEYVLIIAVVVVAAIGILSIFSDTVRSKITGIIMVFDPDNSQAQPEYQRGSQSQFQDLDESGAN